MKPAPFDYVAPRTIEEACQILADAAGGATIIAGGQTLMPLLALRMSQPFILVDINKIDALRGVSRTAEGVRVGPMTRQVEGLADPTLADALPMFVTALSHVGHHQTRNRGTIGGSVALGEPAAEMPATAVALGAQLEVRSVRGTRRIPATELYLGPYMTSLEPDELLTDIHYPSWPGHAVTVFREVAQRPGDFALVGLTGAVVVEGGKIARAGLAWMAMGATPIRMSKVEQALIGQPVTSLDLAGLAELALEDTAPFTDHHATSDYRRSVGRRIFMRTLGEALDLRAAA